MLLAAPGMALLVLGILFPSDGSTVIAHSVLVTCGGLLLATAHFVNLRKDRRLRREPMGAGCAH